jgi:anthranilate phosphoribosyltransferase
MAQSLQAMGIQRAAVVVGSDGLDEVTLAGPTRVLFVEPQRIRDVILTPEDFGMSWASLQECQVSNPSQSAGLVRKILDGKPSVGLDLVVANAALALVVFEKTTSLRTGVDLARQAITSGAAREKLARLCALTQR